MVPVTTSVRRVRLSPDARREQLLELGLKMLATRSLDELSVDDLAEEAGISRGLLFHYFRNKQEFHLEVVRRAAKSLLERTEPDTSLHPLARLAGSLAAYVDYVVENHQAYVSLVRGAASGNDDVREIFDATRTTLTARITDSLELTGLESSPATRLLARGWMAMTEEVVLAWVIEQQVGKDELLTMLTAALPATLSVVKD